MTGSYRPCKNPKNRFRTADTINTCIVQGVWCSEMRLVTRKTAIESEHETLPIVVSRTEAGTCFSCELCQYNLSVPVAISQTARSDAWAASCSGLRVESLVGCRSAKSLIQHAAADCTLYVACNVCLACLQERTSKQHIL